MADLRTVRRHETTHRAGTSDGYARILFDTPYDLQPGNYVGVEMYSSNNANDVSVVDDATVFCWPALSN
ncbi:MAG: hypothetical protein H6597_00070 [Flavobacteriales bacterium]|nr:hypothetical protein [Flavobacteriales bacterium]